MVSFGLVSSIIGAIAYFAAVILAVGGLRIYAGLPWDVVLLGCAGGAVAGVINIPVTIFTTNVLIIPKVLRGLTDWSPTVRRGARLGLKLSIRTKQYISYFTVVGAYLGYISLMSYAFVKRIMDSGGVFEVGPDAPILSVFDMIIPEASIETRIIVTYSAMIIAGLVLTLYVATLAAHESTAQIRELQETAHRRILSSHRSPSA